MDIKKVLLVKSLGELLIITACLSHNNNTSHRYPQEEEIRMSINLPYVEGTNEKLGRSILRSHKIRPTFYTEMTLRKLLSKQKHS